MPCSNGMRRCKATCAHRELVNGYREERERQETAAENDYRERDGNEHAAPLLTFKAWLVANRRPACDRGLIGGEAD